MRAFSISMRALIAPPFVEASHEVVGAKRRPDIEPVVTGVIAAMSELEREVELGAQPPTFIDDEERAEVRRGGEESQSAAMKKEAFTIQKEASTIRSVLIEMDRGTIRGSRSTAR
jgi:hypothetical protein